MVNKVTGLYKLNPDNIHPEENLTEYEHHGMEVTVVKKFKGRHKEICVCHSCEYFKWWEEDNCFYATMAFELSKVTGIVTVMECQYYERVK